MMLNLQAFLDKVIDIIRADDAEGYLSMIDLPYQVITARDTRTFVHRRDMREHFHLFRIGLHQMGFSDLHHRANSATMLGADLATGIYETELFRDDQLFVAPYRSCITLRRSEGVWRAVSTAHTIGHADWMDRMNAVSGMHTTD
ncbi:hypothetical protein FIU94_01110 [Sulfitobacter sp. THAF37]|uniref:hypothetical protein n=1 Tax=Sulfitobacter sp. THAF37 TaxID=2587855 RepID=UPI0012698751|nr:hypothetical protein [Sulfitobacter sp. THAF37]QFT57407.1 hypothetical protein FIU94_01110 [Sulfitobacter sp. THAF37]